jgi:hypothetical protein
VTPGRRSGWLHGNAHRSNVALEPEHLADLQRPSDSDNCADRMCVGTLRQAALLSTAKPKKEIESLVDVGEFRW